MLHSSSLSFLFWPCIQSSSWPAACLVLRAGFFWLILWRWFFHNLCERGQGPPAAVPDLARLRSELLSSEDCSRSISILFACCLFGLCLGPGWSLDRFNLGYFRRNHRQCQATGRLSVVRGACRLETWVLSPWYQLGQASPRCRSSHMTGPNA